MKCLLGGDHQFWAIIKNMNKLSMFIITIIFKKRKTNFILFSKIKIKIMVLKINWKKNIYCDNFLDSIIIHPF